MAIIHVVLGSESDLPVVKSSGLFSIFDEVLPDHLGYSLEICSAHRNARELDEFAQQVVAQRTRVVIAAAGMAAALPGALAATTRMNVPIIGVPLDEHGIDSCIYMPPGVPVLTSGVGKAGLKNAAIAALQIIRFTDDAINTSFVRYLSDSAKAPKFNVPVY